MSADDLKAAIGQLGDNALEAAEMDLSRLDLAAGAWRLPTRVACCCGVVHAHCVAIVGVSRYVLAGNASCTPGNACVTDR